MPTNFWTEILNDYDPFEPDYWTAQLEPYLISLCATLDVEAMAKYEPVPIFELLKANPAPTWYWRILHEDHC